MYIGAEVRKAIGVLGSCEVWEGSSEGSPYLVCMSPRVPSPVLVGGDEG